jgi:hypothetical protein
VKNETPERRAPVVEPGPILGPRCAVVGRLEGIAFANRPPLGIQRLVSGRRANITDEAFLTRAKPGEVALRGLERRHIRGSAELRPPKLHQVVLPEADEADVIGTRRVREDEVSAARTRIARIAHFSRQDTACGVRALRPA